MNDVRYVEVIAEENGQRLDNYLLRILKGVPKSHIYRIIRSGEVRVNKGRVKPLSRIHTGDKIRIPPIRCTAVTEIKINENLEQKLIANIIYEDAKFLVINKPSGIAVHGGSGLSLGIIEAFRKIRKDLPYLELVHRLDKDTSGCLVLAKKRSALRMVQALLAERKVNKVYWALLKNPWIGKKEKIINLPLEKNILKSGERLVVANAQGKPSQTKFKLLENFNNSCLVEAVPKTGRTHQIRVHSASIGHSILGDSKYGEPLPETLKKRLYLHAHAISFTLNDQIYSFQAEIDEIFADALKKLQMQS